MPINAKPVIKEQLEKKDSKQSSFSVCLPKYNLQDVILPESIINDIQDAIALYKYRKLIFAEWGLGNVIKKQNNISINLYGNSGTGKTMCAHAIASELGMELVVVDYSEIESKFVGETSKNLMVLFEFAKQNNCIILFDEADALLSKRVTDMTTAADVSVNQTRNVLLKLLDEYNGVVIFTTNFINNFDTAFFRRIMSHIRFEMPTKEIRTKLWEHYLVKKLPLAEDRNYVIDKLSVYENVTGADISVAVLKAAVHSAVLEKEQIHLADLQGEIEKILNLKQYIDNDRFDITSRKVSEEYVKDKIGKDIV